VRHLSVRYGGVAALDDVSLTLVPGSIHGLIGPNGAGKTTLVNAVSGLRPPTRGEIHLFGRRVEGLRSHRIARLGLARTFQTSQLVETLSVLDNVASGLWAHGRHSLITHAPAG
jgi:ABC-type branched-subunit amino acid transport system ATPase component